MKLGLAVYRYVLEAALSNKEMMLTENGIAKVLGISPNTVSIAVRNLETIGAVSIYKRHFELINFDKALYYMCAGRRISADIVYSTYFRENIAEIEKAMPDEIAYTAYTAYANLFGNDASDYSEVYVYATEKSTEEIRHRFPKGRLSQASDYANIIVLKPDRILANMMEGGKLEKASAPVIQVYADLWNIKTWYAQEFEKKLKARIDGMHG